jgi:hypothetical protein
METLTMREIFEELDKLNKVDFKYIGIRYLGSGCRITCEAHQEFIKNLKSVPIRKIKVKYEGSKLYNKIKDNFITIEVESCFVNIYNIDNIKEFRHLKEATKHKCIFDLECL